ncbi:hypothetical protein Lal_00014198 [Lupinus albus]|nr:hypothetical protein Lal_00014198 [Lupinus albus]
MRWLRPSRPSIRRPVEHEARRAEPVLLPGQGTGAELMQASTAPAISGGRWRTATPRQDVRGELPGEEQVSPALGRPHRLHADYFGRSRSSGSITAPRPPDGPADPDPEGQGTRRDEGAGGFLRDRGRGRGRDRDEPARPVRLQARLLHLRDRPCPARRFSSPRPSTASPSGAFWPSCPAGSPSSSGRSGPELRPRRAVRRGGLHRLRDDVGDAFLPARPARRLRHHADPRLRHGAAGDPPFLRETRRGPDPRHLRHRHRPRGGLRAWFGGNSQRVPVPSWGVGATKLGFLVYPTYRLQLIGIVAALLVGLYLVLYRTAIGLVVRAGIENAGMVGILGIDVRRTFLLVFAIGIVAVGLAGMLYAPVVSVTPDMGASFMVQSFVVIVLGGLGSFPGAVVGGLIAGEACSARRAACDAACNPPCPPPHPPRTGPRRLPGGRPRPAAAAGLLARPAVAGAQLGAVRPRARHPVRSRGPPLLRAGGLLRDGRFRRRHPPRLRHGGERLARSPGRDAGGGRVRPPRRLARRAAHRHLLRHDHPGLRPDGLLHREFPALGLDRWRERHRRGASSDDRLRGERRADHRRAAHVRAAGGHLPRRIRPGPPHRALARGADPPGGEGEHRPRGDARPRRPSLQARRLHHRRPLCRARRGDARAVPELHAAGRLRPGDLRATRGADHRRRRRHPGRAAGRRGPLAVAARQPATHPRPRPFVEARPGARLHRPRDRPAPGHLRGDPASLEPPPGGPSPPRGVGSDGGHRGERRGAGPRHPGRDRPADAAPGGGRTQRAWGDRPGGARARPALRWSEGGRRRELHRAPGVDPRGDRAERGGQEHPVQDALRRGEPERGRGAAVRRAADRGRSEPGGPAGCRQEQPAQPTLPEPHGADNLRVAALARARGGFRLDLLAPADGRPEVEAQVATLMDLLDLGERAGTPASVLAYGEKRRLEIGMALATSPNVLLLDEPLAGMSLSERAATCALIRRIAKACTVVVVEHDLDAIFELAERITVLCEGRLLADGPTDLVRRDAAVQRAYLGAGPAEAGATLGSAA